MNELCCCRSLLPTESDECDYVCLNSIFSLFADNRMDLESGNDQEIQMLLAAGFVLSTALADLHHVACGTV